MKHKLVLGIEHLMTGAQLLAKSPITFERESATMVRVLCDSPIKCHWPVMGSWIDSTECDITPTRYSSGEAEWYAQAVAAKMREADERSYKMQTYSRVAHEEFIYDSELKVSRPTGRMTRLEPNEPEQFPLAVITAMRRKHGKDADEYLAKLRWNGDHWFYNVDRMYVGVEPDGYIHT